MIPIHMLDLRALVIAQAPLAQSELHGVTHWNQVRANGFKLIDAGAVADRKVVELFALLHDCQRIDEWADPDHGQRAADYMIVLWQQGRLDITEWQMGELHYAIRYHTGERRAGIFRTAGVCWDADRLDLPRVGVDVDPAYLSTKQARRMIRRRWWSRR